MTRNEADLNQVLKRIRRQAASDNLRVTLHAHREMADDNFSLDEVLEAIASGKILENYPEHRRGACCLLYGRTNSDRPVHIGKR